MAEDSARPEQAVENRSASKGDPTEGSAYICEVIYHEVDISELATVYMLCGR